MVADRRGAASLWGAAALLSLLMACGGDPTPDPPEGASSNPAVPTAETAADPQPDLRDIEAQKAEALARATANAASTDADAPEWVGGPGTLTIVYTNNIDGEIEPCG